MMGLRRMIRAAGLLSVLGILLSGAASAQCCGDRDDDGEVSLGEVQASFNVFLGAAQCEFDDRGFVDNGDGTITDTRTGLMWEKKNNVAGGLHDKEFNVRWRGAMGDFISEMNGLRDDGTQRGFAGHSDWRLPTVNELKSILLEPFECGTDPCIDRKFGPTASDQYWSSSTDSESRDFAYTVDFRDGRVGAAIAKDVHQAYVRAVRGIGTLDPGE